ncbi:MAG: cytochrome c-type biosis protein CcmB [Actinomycetota bacterium]
MSKMSQRRTIAVAVARKDLTIEWNSKVLVNQVAPFAAIIMVMFAFALDNDGILQRVAPGLVWLATLFSMLVVIQRTFAVESADGALDALRVAGVDTSAIFAGKSGGVDGATFRTRTTADGNGSRFVRRGNVTSRIL